jgi:hypothetical protein
VNYLKLCFVLSLATIGCSALPRTQMPRPASLPDVVLDCYQSFTTTTAFPESHWDMGEFPIDGDNFDTPLPRYRLQVVDHTVLKVIKDPTRAAFLFTDAGYNGSNRKVVPERAIRPTPGESRWAPAM